MGKFGIFEYNSDFSSSSSSLASSSSDEEKKMKKKASKGKDHKYRPDAVPAYQSVAPAPEYRKKGEGMKKARCLPPPADAAPPEFKPTPVNLPEDFGKIDEDKAKKALLKHVDSKLCWRKGAAEEMELSDLKLSNAFTYRCEMFTEVRKVKWKSVGYRKGDHVDPPKAGDAPAPWEMKAEPKQRWSDEKKKMQVPHSMSVRKCWYCKGKGKVRCRECKGKEFFDCDGCDGSGEVDGGEEGPAPCGRCGGSGKRACGRCHGHGKYECKTCNGRKKLKWYLQNMVKWEKQKQEKVFEDTALPDELVDDAKGQELFVDEQPTLKPLSEFPEPHMPQFSKELLPAMQQKYSKEGRILMQRHAVLVTPVTEVSWKFEDQSGKFFVFGLDNQVYFPDYPQQCCCSLL